MVALGAGVCADDLHRLSTAYEHNDFVDADGEAMDSGLRQPDVDFETTRSHRGVELTLIEQKWHRNLEPTDAVLWDAMSSSLQYPMCSVWPHATLTMSK